VFSLCGALVKPSRAQLGLQIAKPSAVERQGVPDFQAFCRVKYSFRMSKLRDGFVDELRDLYNAEKQLLAALPKMAKAAENAGLKKAFEQHKGETQEQIKRLEKVFKVFGETVRGKKCKGMEGLIEEAKELIEEEEGDAALIAAAQKAEHYEISAYGTLAAWAKSLSEDKAVQLLTETLEEEKETDEKLTQLAETIINQQESEEEEV
jgi:ferritin-like metal-binding protein YciE